MGEVDNSADLKDGQDNGEDDDGPDKARAFLYGEIRGNQGTDDTSGRKKESIHIMNLAVDDKNCKSEDRIKEYDQVLDGVCFHQVITSSKGQGHQEKIAHSHLDESTVKPNDKKYGQLPPSEPAFQ